MDFSLTEEQVAIADMAKGIFKDCCTDEYLREFDVLTASEANAAPAPYMKALWQTCVETGLHGLYIPESVGGSGLGMTELMLVLQAQGAALGQVPLWRHQLAAACLTQFGDDSLMPIILAAAEAAELLTLNLPVMSADTCDVEATQTSDGYILSGRLAAVASAASARYALVPVSLSSQTRLALVDLNSAGIEAINGVLTQGEQVTDLHFDNCVVTAKHLLAEPAFSWLEPRAIAAQAALQLGVSEEQIGRTVDYIKERRQFERPIASFQAVQMSMADCRIALETLRSNLWQLCYRLDAGLGAESEALATAWQACEAGHLIGHKCLHVHGGFGVDVSYPIHRYLYWSRALGLGLGGSRAIAERLGDWLTANDKLGWKYDLDENQ